MSDVGLIFSPPMVRALLAGTKTMTRRILKPRKGLTLGDLIRDGEHEPGIGYRCAREQVADPAVAPGDKIWVKETWSPSDPGPSFRADCGPEVDNKSWGWTSPRYMPKAIARIWLTVEDVRVERLQSITEEDAEAEGMPAPYLGDGDAPFEEQAVMVTRRMQFRNLWDQLHGAGAWAENPWCAAIKFRREEP